MTGEVHAVSGSTGSSRSVVRSCADVRRIFGESARGVDLRGSPVGCSKGEAGDASSPAGRGPVPSRDLDVGSPKSSCSGGISLDCVLDDCARTSAHHD